MRGGEDDGGGGGDGGVDDGDGEVRGTKGRHAVTFVLL